MPEYSRATQGLAATGFLDPSPSGTAARIGIADADERGLMLSDQDYYNRFIRPEEMTLRQQGERAGGAVGRGARIAQGDFMTAQGLGGTSLGQGAERGMAAVFQPARRQAMDRARLQGEELRRQKFQERDAELNKINQGISQGHAMESQVVGGIMQAIPFTAPFAPLASGGIAAKGIPYSTMTTNVVNRLNRDADPLRTVDYGSAIYGGDGGTYGYGGGGGDFGRLYGR